MSGSLSDITERKFAEAEQARLQIRLRQAEKMEAVGRLAGGIAHDFNNILGGILGYAELLAENAPPGSPLKRYAENVLTGANRAGSLVEQILSYSRSQRGKRVPVDFRGIVAETLELVRGSLPHGIRLVTDLPAAPLHVIGPTAPAVPLFAALVEKLVMSSPSGSVAESVTVTGASSSVLVVLGAATGGSGVSVTVTVKALSKNRPFAPPLFSRKVESLPSTDQM